MYFSGVIEPCSYGERSAFGGLALGGGKRACALLRRGDGASSVGARLHGSAPSMPIRVVYLKPSMLIAGG
jgi:hypothetical protein